MSLISFDREAGIDVLATPAAQGGETESSSLCSAIEAHIARLGLRAEWFQAVFEPTGSVLRVTGCAPSQDMRERIVLCCGNVQGVAAVDDRMTVVMPSEVSRWRFVQPGDTLERIAEDLYRDARRATQLHAANRPLLGDGDGDELRPGWRLRVP